MKKQVLIEKMTPAEELTATREVFRRCMIGCLKGEISHSTARDVLGFAKYHNQSIVTDKGPGSVLLR